MHVFSLPSPQCYRSDGWVHFVSGIFPIDSGLFTQSAIGSIMASDSILCHFLFQNFNLLSSSYMCVHCNSYFRLPICTVFFVAVVSWLSHNWQRFYGSVPCGKNLKAMILELVLWSDEFKDINSPFASDKWNTGSLWHLLHDEIVTEVIIFNYLEFKSL